MISYTNRSWKVVTERAQGLLAAQFAAQWEIAERPDRWVETLLAIAGHDDAAVELDGENLLTPAGESLNFDMKQFAMVHCEKPYMLTQTKNRFIALITSIIWSFYIEKRLLKTRRQQPFKNIKLLSVKHGAVN